MNAFTALGVSDALTDIMKLQGIVKPTPIQEASIPSIFKGKDVIGRSQTYLLPVIQRVDTEKNTTQVLIMTPTRELSRQIFDVLRPFAIKLDIDAADIIGGRTIENQLRKLKRDPAVIIGTPGRLLDHIRRRSLDLSNVKTVILDEADQMLANGFREDIEALVDETPKKRQVLLFSATMPDDAKRLARKYMNQPVYIDVAEKAAASTVDQRVYETTKPHKFKRQRSRSLSLQILRHAVLMSKASRTYSIMISREIWNTTSTESDVREEPAHPASLLPMPLRKTDFF